MHFICLILWPFVQALGSESWPVREQAQRVLVRAWPLSEPVLVRGQYISDPEIRQRCQQALTQARQYQPKGMRGFTVLAVPTELEEYCLGLIVRDHETDGLPVASKDMHEHWDNIYVRRELQRLNVLYGLTDNEIRESPPPPWLGNVWNTYSDEIVGIDDLRFAYRGLDGSQFEMKRLWAVKKAWRGKRK